MKEKWAIAGAAAWSVGLIVAGATWPAYTSGGAAGTTVVSVAPGYAAQAPAATPSSVVGFARPVAAAPTVHFADGASRTLVQVNGARALLVLAIPLVLVIIVALILRTSHPRLAWPVTGLAVVFCFLGALTIGPFVFPVAILLVVACALHYAYP